MDALNEATPDNHFEALRRQTVLAKFGELALACDDLDEILTEACRLVGEALGTELAKVMELQKDGETLLVRAGVGWKPGVVGEVTLRATEDSSEGHALKTGEPMTSPDIDKETRFKYPPFLTENGVKAVANVIIIGGQDKPPYGILQIDSRKPRQFTDDDTAFLRSYANLLAAAVDRLRVMEEGRDREERLRLALEAGELGSWELDLATGAATTAPRTMQIFGYTDTAPAWSYDVFLDHVLAEDREHVESTFRQAVDTGMEWHADCRIHRADNNEIRWIEIRARPSGARGNTPPTRLHGIVADITWRKETEEALRRANEGLEANVAERTRELVEANAKLRTAAEERERVEEALRQSHKMEAVGQLTGGLAHDFNNLLTGISGSLELMRSRAAQGRMGDFERYNETAMTSVNRAAALTHRLLAFSRRQTLDPKAIGVDRLVGGLEDLFRHTVGPAIRVETKQTGELWPALCDTNQLENALLNLVINARDAMPEGGHLLIETTNIALNDQRGANNAVPVKSVPSGEYVALAVTDTGTGMPPSVLARAVDPFFTTKPPGLGTGLGLSMIYGFVQQSGGYLHLRSVEGQGTTVTIYLARYLGEADDTIKVDVAIGPPPVDAGTVVLVVDDEQAVRMVVLDALSDLGYTTREAEDGRAGLRILQSTTRVDLLLTDVGLPGGINGRQLADAARQLRPDLKVLFITGFAEAAGVGDGLLGEGMHVMTKPFALAALAAKVESIIRHSL
jgi:PAS domain S-box-containing protein